MTERVTIRARGSGRRSIRFLVMTNSARRDLATRTRVTRRRVTRVAVVMRREVRGDRKAHAAINRRTMTTRTTALRARRAGVVLRMIELDVEWLVEARRKILQRRIVAADIRVTDLAHRHLRRSELAAMTIRAGFVTRKARRRGVVGAFVTRVAGDGTVALAFVKKLRVIGLRRLRRCSAENNECYQNEPRHLMSLRLSGGRSAIR